MGLDVEVPPKVEVTGPPPESEKTQLVVNLRGDGIYLNNQKMESLTALRDALAPQMVSRQPDERVVFINAEDQLAFSGAVQVIDTAHAAGAQKIGFLTDPPK
jgi:biopolymer transport protein TolR